MRFLQCSVLWGTKRFSLADLFHTVCQVLAEFYSVCPIPGQSLREKTSAVEEKVEHPLSLCE